MATLASSPVLGNGLDVNSRWVALRISCDCHTKPPITTCQMHAENLAILRVVPETLDGHADHALPRFKRLNGLPVWNVCDINTINAHNLIKATELPIKVGESPFGNLRDVNGRIPRNKLGVAASSDLEPKIFSFVNPFAQLQHHIKALALGLGTCYFQRNMIADRGQNLKSVLVGQPPKGLAVDFKKPVVLLQTAVSTRGSIFQDTVDVYRRLAVANVVLEDSFGTSNYREAQSALPDVKVNAHQILLWRRQAGHD
mmetsp:Transcript_28172/g.73848  ORF Transcript_28172/g.73848 Transcript_28172/m.73848 type:complete len:256 (+) Transcript_28172:158-925(+)